ncbi:MAG TPA: hypothetical protein VKT78_06260 [Fimbriimonadaceae bacterium]|nr:hypothetical protein [Fimbriimonadaceae bacterium]
MRPHVCTALLGCLALVAGCSRPNATAAATGSVPASAGAPPPSTSAPGTPDSGSAMPASPPEGTPAPPPPSYTSPLHKSPDRPKVVKVPSGQTRSLATPGWKKSNLSPAQLAARIDKTLWGLKGADCDINIEMILPIGSAQLHHEAKFADPKRFRVDFPVVEGAKPHTQTVTVIADGHDFAELHPGRKQAWTLPRAYQPGGMMDDATVLKGWSTDMPRLAMSHFVSGRDAFVPLVRALTAPGSGFTVRSEEQTLTSAGHFVTLYHLYAVKPDPKSKQPLAEYEIRVMSPRERPNAYLPVTMKTQVTPRGKNAFATIVTWSGRWDNLTVTGTDYALPSSR